MKLRLGRGPFGLARFEILGSDRVVYLRPGELECVWDSPRITVWVLPLVFRGTLFFVVFLIHRPPGSAAVLRPAA